MKKLLAVLLSVLMLFSCCSVNVFAETTNNTEFVTTQIFCDNINHYIYDLGLTEYYDIFTPENVISSGKIVVFEQTASSALIQIIGHEEKPASQTLGGYTFNADTFFHESNPCGYLNVYTYSGVSTIKDSCYSDYEVVFYAEKLPNTVNNKPTDVQNAEKLLKEKENATFYLTKLGAVNDEFNLYYNLPYTVQNMAYYKYFDNYEFFCSHNSRIMI